MNCHRLVFVCSWCAPLLPQGMAVRCTAATSSHARGEGWALRLEPAGLQALLHARAAASPATSLPHCAAGWCGACGAVVSADACVEQLTAALAWAAAGVGPMASSSMDQLVAAVQGEGGSAPRTSGGLDPAAVPLLADTLVMVVSGRGGGPRSCWRASSCACSTSAGSTQARHTPTSRGHPSGQSPTAPQHGLVTAASVQALEQMLPRGEALLSLLELQGLLDPAGLPRAGAVNLQALARQAADLCPGKLGRDCRARRPAAPHTHPLAPPLPVLERTTRAADTLLDQLSLYVAQRKRAALQAQQQGCAPSRWRPRSRLPATPHLTRSRRHAGTPHACAARWATLRSTGMPLPPSTSACCTRHSVVSATLPV